MGTYMKTDNANNQYLGYCSECKEFGAVSNLKGLCWKCKIKKKGDLK